MTSHMGFAHSLREGLKVINTEYVMVLQHDRAFAEQINIHPILELFDREKAIQYIGFQTATTKQYPYKKLKSKYFMNEKKFGPSVSPYKYVLICLKLGHRISD